MVLWYRFRAELRTRLWAWLGLAVVVGVAAGAVMALAAGARRTDNAYTRFFDHNQGFDVLVVNSESDGTAVYDFDELAKLPEVSDAVSAGFAFARLGMAGGTPAILPTDDRMGTDINIFKVTDGRLANPTRPDEAVVSVQVADQIGVAVGDTFDVFTPRMLELVEDEDVEGLLAARETIDDVPVSDAEARQEIEGLLAWTRPILAAIPDGKIRVVGIVAAPGEVPPQFYGAIYCCVHHTPAFTELFQPEDGILGVRLRGGSAAIPAFLDELGRRGGELDPQVIVSTEHQAGVARSVGTQASALWLLAGLVALTSALVLTQLLARIQRLDASDDATLVALGMRRGQRFALALVRAAAIGTAGAVVGAGIAIAASPLFPTGLAGVVEPDPGIDLDPAVVLVGGVATVGVVMLLSAAPAWLATKQGATSASTNARRQHSFRIPRAVRGYGPAADVGLRMAFQRGSEKNAVPVGTSLAAVALGIATLVGALTFSSSLDNLLSSPRLYGVNWDLVVWNGGSGLPVVSELAPNADSYDGVAAVAKGGQTTIIDVEGHQVQLAAFDALVGDVLPPVVEGNRPSAPGEVALGANTMGDLGVGIGDSIRATTPRGEDAELRVVGRAVLPTLEEGLQLGTGGYVASATLLQLTDAPLFGTDDGSLYIELEPGADEASLFAEMRAAVCNPDDLFCAVNRVPIETPGQIVDFGRVRSTPAILGGVLALLAAGALAHVLVTSVRQRRRTFATLKALGFTRRQSAAAVVWQATSFVAAALLIAIPIGIAIGSALWERRSEDLGIVEVTRVPWLLIATIAVVALALACAIALVPGRAAARTPSGRALQGE